MSISSNFKRIASICSIATLGSLGVATGASAQTTEPSSDVALTSSTQGSESNPAVEKLEALGFEVKSVDEQVSMIDSGNLPLSMTDASPVETFEAEVTQDGAPSYERISYFEDGTYSRTVTQLPTADEGFSTFNYVENCTQVQGNRAGFVNNLGCSASWSNGVITYSATVDYGLRAGGTYGGEMLDVYAVSVTSVGGTISSASTSVTNAYSTIESSPARAETNFVFKAFVDAAGQAGTILIEVRPLGAFVSGANAPD